MLATSVARALAGRGIHYGWVMVALALGYGICSSAALSIPGVLLVPMSREFGWSLGELSGPLGLRMALFGMVAPFAGGLMLRYGPRAVLTGSAALLIAGTAIAVPRRSFVDPKGPPYPSWPGSARPSTPLRKQFCGTQRSEVE